MLPRRFALIRHVDYSGGAGTGVIAYGVAFDDGQVVLRWSSAHHATSVLDSIEDLIAAHGHGETTSIEWIDAAPGKDDTPAPAGRRARRPATSPDEQPAGDAAQVPKPPATVSADTPDAPTASQAPQPDGPGRARHAAHAAPAPADAGDSTGPVPTASAAGTAPAKQAAEPAQPAAPATPAPAAAAATPAQPAAQGQPDVPPQSPPAPATEQPAAPEKPAAAQPTPAHQTPAPPARRAAEQRAASAPSWEPALDDGDPSAEPNVAASLGVSRLSPKSASSREKVDDPPAAAHGSPASNGAPPAPEAERRSRPRHEAIATQPMTAEFTGEQETRRPRRGGPPAHQSPRSIFEEAEQPARPDLRLASSNGRGPEPDEADEPADDPPDRNDFAGFFATGHQHLETVTGLLDLPAGLDKRGRDAESEQDASASRRTGRHRGE